MNERWRNNGAEAVGRWVSAKKLWKMGRKERERGEDCWLGTLLDSLLLGSYAIELALKCWSKLAHASAARGAGKPHPPKHELDELWRHFPKGPHKKLLEERWKGWRGQMKPGDRIGSIQKVLDDIGPVFKCTRYVGDTKNEDEEKKQRELLAKIRDRPDHYWRCFDACSRVFISAFPLYVIAEMKRQGKTDDAKELSDCLVQDGGIREEVEEGVRQMQEWVEATRALRRTHDEADRVNQEDRRKPRTSRTRRSHV